MRFAPEIAAREYRAALRAEVAAAFGEQRAQQDESQIDAVAEALRLVAGVELPDGVDPFFLGRTERD